MTYQENFIFSPSILSKSKRKEKKSWKFTAKLFIKEIYKIFSWNIHSSRIQNFKSLFFEYIAFLDFYDFLIQSSDFDYNQDKIITIFLRHCGNYSQNLNILNVCPKYLFQDSKKHFIWSYSAQNFVSFHVILRNKLTL